VRSIEGKIGGVQDLSGSKVVTVAGSSAAAYLRAHAVAFAEVPSIDAAYPRLDSGQADAIVFDAPVLQNRVKVTGNGTEILVGGVFARENYGIALPPGSPLRKKINTALLDITADGTYEELYARYFGDAGSG
jgi:polar amino acid transport system substrate-binding protein